MPCCSKWNVIKLDFLPKVFAARSTGIIYSCTDFVPNLHISDLPGCILAIGSFLMRVVKLWCDGHLVSTLVPKILLTPAEFIFGLFQEATAEGVSPNV